MMTRHLGIDFSLILIDFGGQVGAKLGSKIDQKSIQKGIEKQMRKRRRLGGVLEASWGPKNPSQEPQPLEEFAVAESQPPLFRNFRISGNQEKSIIKEFIKERR